MPNSALIIIVGHIGRDPELKITTGGMAIAKTSLAVKTGWGERQKTTWYNLTAFGKNADRMNEWLKKGMACQIIGTPWQDEYTANDGSKRQPIQVDVTDFTPLERNDQQPAGNGNQQPPADGDIPF